MTSDLDLLRQFTRENSQEAFGEIVRRHLDLVYSAALRQVRSPQLAEEVTQSVFADLARNARKLKPDTILSAWLYAIARRTAIDTVRKEARRQLREQIAVEMNNMNATADDWAQVAPLLDDAMAALDETDRTAVLLRYFENKSLREVGESLAISDDAAQKRVSRAVESLREFFSKQRLTIAAAGLTALISANAVKAAPVELSVTISAVAKTAVGMGVKGLAATKIGTTLGSAGAHLPLFGVFYFLFKATLAEAKSPREHKLIFRFFLIQSFLAAVLACLFAGFLTTSSFAVTKEILFFTAIILGAVVILYSYKRYALKRRQIQIDEGTWVEPEELRTILKATLASVRGNGSKRTMYINLMSACMWLGVIVDTFHRGLNGNWAEATMLIVCCGILLFLLFIVWLCRPRK
jgi:RNA polymerase sigma factor (sigma-70 family)